MYFETGVKTRKRDLFDMENETLELKKALESSRLVVVKGLRRTGKTSLMRVVYGELKANKIFVDVRGIYPFTPRTVSEIFTNLFRKFARISKKITLSIDSIALGGIKVSEPKHIDLLETTEWINGKKIYLFLDEAQNLSRVGFDKFLVYLLDNTDIKLILCGSEIGIISDMIENPKSPLFGRGAEIINIKRFPSSLSLKFLEEGFDQIKVTRDASQLKETIEHFDGMVGWLVLYGDYSKRNDHKISIKKVMKDASSITTEEIKKFLETRGIGKNRYLHILREFSKGNKRWSEIKYSLEKKLGKKIGDRHIKDYLDALIDYGFIEKSEGIYSLTDPMTKVGVDKIKG